MTSTTQKTIIQTKENISTQKTIRGVSGR